MKRFTAFLPESATPSAALLVAALLVLGSLALAACVADQANPYAGQNGLPINWPSTDPNRYHWNGLDDPYFEEWFFRVIAPSGEAFAFCYGVRNPGALDAADSEAFLIAMGSGGRLAQGTFPLDRFVASNQHLEVQVGANSASLEQIGGSLAGDDGAVRWNLTIELEETWTDTMGALTNLPLSSINWYVGMLRGRATGSVTWGDETVDFDGAAIYQDKFWGDALPSAYVWLQASDFPNPGDAFAFAGGLLGGVPSGMFVWRVGATRYEARSQDLNTGVQIAVNADAASVAVGLFQPDRQFHLRGYFAGDPPVAPPAPTANGFVPDALVALRGQVWAQAVAVDDGQATEQAATWATSAGVEIGGDYRNANDH